jgi:hypothetical protein
MACQYTRELQSFPCKTALKLGIGGAKLKILHTLATRKASRIWPLTVPSPLGVLVKYTIEYVWADYRTPLPGSRMLARDLVQGLRY